MENETKAKIFGQYLLQNVLVSDRTPTPRELDFYTANVVKHGAFTFAMLLLKPLSAITNEDAINLANILGVPEIHPGTKTPASKQFLMGKGVEFLLNNMANESHKNLHIFQAFQYLQSRGYALPYMEYSVEDLVKEGIYKLI